MVKGEEVFALTDRGSAQLRETGTGRSPTELEILVLVDGRATVAQIVRSARNLSPKVAFETLGGLVSDGLIRRASELHSDAIDVGDFFSIPVPAAHGEAAREGAEPELALGVSSLREQGYFVRIARRATAARVLPAAQKYAVMVVEDEPHLAKLLRTYLMLEGFATRTAGNREEILAAFREPPRPDLVLLDVTLPDADGFDVLAKMRLHPALKTVPVVMVTAIATREAVIKGILRGADGYITKPFEVDVLLKAVRTVLGLTSAAGAGRKP